MPERSIGHAWKACVPQGTEGSNPSPSEFDRKFLAFLDPSVAEGHSRAHLLATAEVALKITDPQECALSMLLILKTSVPFLSPVRCAPYPVRFAGETTSKSDASLTVRKA